MKLIPPEGPRDRPLLAIVGEAPGQHEEIQGRPFVGPSGHLLDQLLSAARITRGECYITNVSKVRPPSNNFNWMYYEEGNPKFPKQILHDARRETLDELRAVRPKVVIAMGAEALKVFQPYGSISAYRGTMVEAHGLRIVPTLHPSYLLRGNALEQPVVVADLKKAKRQAEFPYKPPVHFNINPTFEEVVAFLKSCPARVALDIETIENRIRCIGFAWSKYEAICINLMKGYTHAWSEEQEREIMTLLDKFLRNPHIEKLIQNITYEWTVMAREYGLQIVNCVMDTMLAHHVLYPELLKGLDFQCSIYTDHPMYWGYDSTSWESTAEYNCYDVVVTFQCAEEHEKELRKRGMWDFYRNIVHRSIESLCYVQSRGVLIDLPAREKIKAETQQEMEEIRGRLATTLGYPLNLGSPKQVSELVYQKWKLPVQIKPQTKKPTTDDDALSALAKKFPIHAPVLRDILDVRQKRVLIATFCDMVLSGQGRVLTSYNVAGTVTGRLASSATIDGVGGNLQNIPRGSFRRVFVADPGKVLIKADLSQAEYRVLIWKARIRRVIERLLNDPTFNIHMWNASENIYKIPIAQVTEQQYANAKNGVYGANYGIGWLKVSRMYNIPSKDAKFIIESYHASVPEIKGVYQKEIEEELGRTRKLVNPLGRERVFLGQYDDEMFRAAYSHYCQSTIGDLINLGLCDLLDWSFEQPDLGLEILLQVHDELVCQCWEQHVEAGCELIRRALERPINVPGTPEPLVIPAGIKVGRNWFDTMSLVKWKESQCLKTT